MVTCSSVEGLMPTTDNLADHIARYTLVTALAHHSSLSYMRWAVRWPSKSKVDISRNAAAA